MSVVNARPSSPTVPLPTQIVKPVVVNARPSTPTAPVSSQIANPVALAGVSPYIKASEVEKAHEMPQQQPQVPRGNSPSPAATTTENCPHCQQFVAQAQNPGFWSSVVSAVAPVAKQVANVAVKNFEDKIAGPRLLGKISKYI